MNIDDDDSEPFVPQQFPGKHKREPAVTTTLACTETQHEREEPDVGVPEQRPIGLTEPYDPVVHGKKVFETAESEAPQPVQASHWFAVFTNPAVVAVATLITAGFLLFLVSEVAQFLQALQALPAFVRVFGFLVAFALAGLLLWSAGRLFLIVFNRPVTPSFDLLHIHDATTRPRIQKLTTTNSEQAKDFLHGLLRDYDFHNPRFRSLLKGCEKTESELDKFESECQRLLSDREHSDESWIRKFRDSVLPFFDDCARKRIEQYARAVGVRTGLMPNGTIDLLIVSSNSLALLGDVCEIYGVRATRVGMLSLAAQIFMNTFVAARLEGQIDRFVTDISKPGSGGADTKETGDVAAEAKAELVASLFGEGTQSVLSSVVDGLSKVVFNVGKRAAEGFANYILCLRFGDSCVKYIRPVKL